MTADRPHGTSDEALIERLLMPILDADGSEQNERLEALCARHPAQAADLRRRFGILERLSFAREPDAATGADPASPTKIGPFHILRRLGEGGMGVVYLAEDTELGRRVALKLIRPELLDAPQARARFKREVEAAAKLDHPGICTVYRAGEVDGRPYLALRHVDGETLEQQLRRSRANDRGAWSSARTGHGSSGGRMRALDLRPAIALVERLALAVHAAHELGLVHRDVKPGNVMVTAAGEPVLMDFGLASVTEDGIALTQSHDLIGTPAYMAPEQVRGRSIDRRTDVHALGVVLYECLTLRLPHVGNTREDLYRSILADTPIDLRRLQPAASRDLATVVHRALAKEPQRRYPTALAFAADLRAVLEDRPTAARPPGPIALSWRWMRRHRAAAAVAVALVAGFASSLVLLARSRAAERQSHAKAEAARASSVRMDPDERFRILRAALDLSPEPEVVAGLNEVLAELQDAELLYVAPHRIESVTRSPSGRWFVVAGQDLPARLHRADGSLWSELPWPILPQRPALAFAPDEEALLVARHVPGPEPRYCLVRCELTGDRPTSTDFGGARTEVPTSIAWGRDHRVAVTFGGGTAHAEIWSSEGDPLVPHLPLPDNSRGCAFLSDGRLALPSGIHRLDGALEVPFDLAHAGRWPAEVRHLLPLGDAVAVVSTAGAEVFGTDGARLRSHLRSLVDFTEQVSSVDAAVDGTLLLAFQDGLVWRLDPGGTQDAWPESGTCWSACFTPDGQRIVAGNFRGRVLVRDRSGGVLHQWQGHRLGVSIAPIGTDGVRFLTGGWDGAVTIWTPGRVPGLPLQSGFSRAVVVSRGDRLVVAASDGRVLALDGSGEIVRQAFVEAENFCLLHPDRDGRSVWIGSVPSGTVQRWDPATGNLGPVLRARQPDRGFPTSLAHLASGALLCCSEWGEPWLLDSEQGTPLPWPPRVSGQLPASQVAAAPGGDVAVAVTARGLLRVHDGSGAVVWTVRDPDAGLGEDRHPHCLVVSPDGTAAVVGSDDGSVALWDLGRRQRIARWHDHQGRVRSVAIAADGSHVASVTTAGHLVVRKVGGAKVFEWHSDGETLESVAFFGSDAVVTTGWRDSGRLRWWWWDPVVLRGKLARVRPMLESVQRR